MLFTRRMLLSAILAIIFGLLVAFYFITINTFAKYPQSTDFYKIYSSAKFFWEKKDIYTFIPFEKRPLADTQAPSEIKTLHPNLNSPFHTLFMSLFGLLSFNQAILIWSTFSLGCGLGAVALISYYMSGIGFNMPLVLGLWVLLFFYFPSWVNFRLGQFGFLLLLLVTGVWATSKRGAENKAGIILGLAIALKLFLGIFLIFFAVNRRWRLLCWAIATFLFCNLLSLLIFGIPTYLKFLSLLQEMPWYAGSWNSSFTGFFTRIFGGSKNHALFDLPWLSHLLSSALALLLLSSLIWSAWPRATGSPADRFDASFSLASIAMLLISPYGWIYYFPILFIPVIVMWHISERLGTRLWYKILLAAAWVLSSIPTSLVAAEDIAKDQAHLWFFTSGGFYFYSLLIFAGVSWSMLRRLNQGIENR